MTSQGEPSSTSFTSQNQDISTYPYPSPYGGEVDEADGDLSRMDDSGEFDEQEFEQPPKLSGPSLAAAARSGEGKEGQTTWASLESPFEKLKREVDSDFSFAEGASPISADGYQKMQVEKARDERHSSDDNKQMPRTTPRKAGGSNLAAQVLRSQHEQQKKSARKVHATPKRGTTNQGNPFANGKEVHSVRKDNPQRWNGIADLRKTPLAKIKADSRKGKEIAIEDGGDDFNDSLAWPEGMSPPVTKRIPVPQSRYIKTPAKEAAQLVVDDLLRTVEGASPAMRRKLLQDKDLFVKQKSRAGMAMGGLASTPLKKGAQKGRKSLPTPPTVTKRQTRGGPNSNSPAGISSSRLLDEDEDGLTYNDLAMGEEEEVSPDLGTGLSRLALTQSSASIDKLLEVNDDDDDSSGEEESDSDSEEDLPRSSTRPGASRSHVGNGSDYPTGSSLVSNSRSIDQDTLFGIRDPNVNNNNR